MLGLEGYTDRGVIHAGARSRVHRAVRDADAALVVIKTSAVALPSAADRRRLHREFAIASNLKAGGVVRHLGLETGGAGLALVMEDFGGRSLDLDLPRGGLDVEAFLTIALELASTLGPLHDAGLIHCDLKPSNILRNPSTREVRLCDFGASIYRQAQATVGSADRPEATIAYLAPEQTGRTSHAVDHRSDLYTLGVTFFELLTGARPFQSDDPLELIHAHLARPPRSPRELRPDVPEPLAQIVLRLLAKSPDGRYRSARGLRADLAQCLRLYRSTPDVPTFELGTADVSARLLVPERLYGRQREGEALLTAVAAVAGSPAKVLLVKGAAGVGKSSLTAQARRPVLAAGGRFCEGKFEQLQRDVPYAAVAAALRSLLRGYLSDPVAELDAHRARIAAALGPNGRLISDVLPELELLLGTQPPVVSLPPLESQNRLRFVFLSFLQAVAPESRPVVMFLDDLHWADAASIGLIDAVVSDGLVRNLVILGAYRSNELDADHPLLVLRDRLALKGLLEEIELTPLRRDLVDALVADALSQSPRQVADLGALVWEKTRGNPFFVGQFLHALVEERVLWFDDDLGRWQWDLARAAAKDLTDNVVDLMLSRLQRLQRGALDLLRKASCVGNPFDAEAFRLLPGWDPDESARGLDELLAEGLVVPLDDGRFRFLHDRVQQAARQLVSADELSEIHLAVGRELLRATADAAEARAGRLFDILHHLNAAHDRLVDPAERRVVAALNLRGSARAKASGAYAAARDMAGAALDALGDGGWASDRTLCLAAHELKAEAGLLLGELDAMEAAVQTVLRHARSPLERVRVYEIRIRALTGAYRAREAVEAAAEILGQLGVHLDLAPGRLDVLRGILHARWLLRGRSPAALRALPEATDPDAVAAMRILAGIAVPAFFVSANLFPVVTVEMLRLTLQRGLSPHSSTAFSTWAMVLVAGFGDIPGGTAASELALALAGRPESRGLEARALAVDGCFVRHWTHPLRDAFAPLRRGYELGHEVGDHEAAALSAVTLCSYMFVAGLPLEEVEEATGHHATTVRRLKQERFALDLARNAQLVRCLQGRAPRPATLSGEHFDAAAGLAAYLKENDHANVSLLTYMQALLEFLLGDVGAAAGFIRRSFAHIENVSGTAFRPPAEVLSALITARRAHGAGRPMALLSLRRSLSRLRAWAAVSPENNEHRASLVEAEVARLEGRPFDAVTAYERAVRSAARGRFVHEKAMAHEVAARFYLGRAEPRLARDHLEAAREAYLAWGAAAKVEHLEREHRALLPPRPTARPSTPPGASPESSTEASSEQLDLRSVIKAAQAISGEIVLGQLLRRLMKIVIESAGAERGLLVLESGGSLRVMAEGAVEGAEVEVLQGLLIEEARLPRSVINYVARTRATVVLPDAGAEGAFTADPYIVARSARSILCAPLVVQGELVGIVYLENHLAAGAFTEERTELLRILAGQAAISLQNARLYDDLQRAHDHQVRLAAAQARFVPNEFLRSLDHADILGVSLGESVHKEMSILFADIRGFTSLIEAMDPREHIDFINSFISYMEPAIIASGGFVDSYVGDAIMALFDGPADAAVGAAVAMTRALGRFNAERAAGGGQRVRMGIGLNTGALTLGTIGGPMRVKCGVIGDPVNLASRLEALTKVYRASLLISHWTLEALQHPGAFQTRQVDRVTVKGKSVPVTIYEVLDAEPEPVRSAKLRTAERFREATERYYDRDFRAAEGLFHECLRECEDDAAARLFVGRCARNLQREVGAGWTGVEHLEQK